MSTHNMFLWKNKKKYQYFWVEKSALTNAMPIRLLDPGSWYKFTFLMTNSADPDQLASSEAN